MGGAQLTRIGEHFSFIGAQNYIFGKSIYHRRGLKDGQLGE